MEMVSRLDITPKFQVSRFKVQVHGLRFKVFGSGFGKNYCPGIFRLKINKAAG